MTTQIELDRARRNHFAADARWSTALHDLEKAAEMRMPADT